VAGVALMMNDCLIVSVESRKGGVGKTTAALNMARLLLEKKEYAVLFLDVDITGTNSTDAIDSPFWKGICHVVEYSEKTEHNRANLIKIFERYFMPGFGVPEFHNDESKNIESNKKALTFIHNKINVIGSQIIDFGDSQKIPELICRPSILFDELHAFWFIEFLQEICASFIAAIKHVDHSRKIAVIVDNSPGYIGIGPAVQEWLTDIGPQIGKFLTISSLDKQDLLSCGYSIESLHKLYANKWNASRKFSLATKTEAVSDNELQLTKDEERFFLRLVEANTPIQQHKEAYCSFDDTDTNLSFYREDNDKNGGIYRDRPEKYQGLLINRVPRLVKSGIFTYETDELYDFVYPIASKSFNRLIGDDTRRYADWMVSYDEYIEYQFFQPFISKSERRGLRRMHHFVDELMMFIEKLNARSEYKAFHDIFHGKFGPEVLEESRMMLFRLHESITEVLRFLEEYGYGHLTRLIHEEWLPGNILKGFRTALQGILLRSGFPFEEFEFMDIKREKYSPEIIHVIERIESVAMRHMKEHEFSNARETLMQFIPSLSLVAALSISTPHIWHSPMEKDLIELFATFASLEVMHWEQRQDSKKTKMSIQRFLASDKLSEKDLMKFHIRHLFHYPEKENHTIIRLYNQCSSVQSRLIDAQQDTEFLMALILGLVKEEIHNPPLLPYIRGVVEKVIVNKTLTHESGRQLVAKGFSSAQYMEEFTSVLSKILERWDIPV